jgi:alpha-glucosidase
MLLTLRGTPYLYYGEEIGMRDISLRRDEILDPPGKRFWPFYKGRDGCRSPMQWDDTAYAGFSSAKPWLPVHPNYRIRNVKSQQEDPEALLNFTRTLIKLRREIPALQHGDFKLLSGQSKDALAYARSSEQQNILVALNFKNHPVKVVVPQGKWTLLLSTNKVRSAVVLPNEQAQLAPYEVLILELARE